jgi:chromatin remodeling complex protein RSC6
VDDASGSDPTSSSGVESDVILAEFNRIDKLIEEFSKRVPILRNKMRTARKLYTQERKAARARPSRAAARAARAAAAASGGADVPRKASSFTKEVAISDIMANFMGLPVGSRPRRNDAVNHVTKYIKDNKLNQSRTILPDDRLKALLGPLQEGHTEYHYFTLQKYLARHFGQKAIDSGLVSNANPSVSVSAPAS